MILQPSAPGGSSRALAIAAILVVVTRTGGAAEPGNAAATSAALAARLEASMPGPWPLFPPDNWWNTEISAAPVDSGSAAYIAYINQGGVKHLHPDLGCLDLAERRRAFPRALRLPGPLSSSEVRAWLGST